MQWFTIQVDRSTIGSPTPPPSQITSSVTIERSCDLNVPFSCFRFYLVFEKVNGGPLLTRIQEHIHFTEREASQIIGDLASALQFLHVKGDHHFKGFYF